MIIFILSLYMYIFFFWNDVCRVVLRFMFINCFLLVCVLVPEQCMKIKNMLATALIYPYEKHSLDRTIQRSLTFEEVPPLEDISLCFAVFCISEYNSLCLCAL